MCVVDAAIVNAVEHGKNGFRCLLKGVLSVQ